MLSHQQLETFNREGVLVVENIIDEATLTAIRAEYAALMDKYYAQWQAQGLVPAARPEMSFWDKFDKCVAGDFEWYQPFDIALPHQDIAEDTPMHFGKAVFDMVTHKNILDCVEQLIGSEITSNPIQHVRIKPPQREVSKSEQRAHVIATGWHQDKGVTLPEADETQFITVWLAITDATMENGCLQVAGGDHDEMYPHCVTQQVTIPDQFLHTGTVRALPVKAGGAVLFHPLTPHGSLPNMSDSYRWSFDLRYNVTGQPTGRSQFPEFVARSRNNPASELRDWRQWKAMWEGTRERLANRPHIDQHRWGNDAAYCA